MTSSPSSGYSARSGTIRRPSCLARDGADELAPELGLPAVGVARVAPQTVQTTVVAGRLKTVCSVEQSGHFTTQKGEGARMAPISGAPRARGSSPASSPVGPYTCTSCNGTLRFTRRTAFARPSGFGRGKPPYPAVARRNRRCPHFISEAGRFLPFSTSWSVCTLHRGQYVEMTLG